MTTKRIMLQALVFLFVVSSGYNPMFAQKKVIVEEPTIQTAQPQHKTIKRKVAIGRFSNETEYGKGLFYDKENDPMGKQALDILSTKLAASGKFLLLERNDLAQLLEEANRNGTNAQQAMSER